jgi:hypothetical protein
MQRIMSDTVQVASGNSNASQDLGQSIFNEVTFDVSFGLILDLIIAVCAVVGISAAVIIALKSL